jgi:hypothetical protein
VKVFKNKRLRIVFGPKRDEVKGGWKKLHNVYSSPSIIRYQVKKDEMDWSCSTNGGEEECI